MPPARPGAAHPSALGPGVGCRPNIAMPPFRALRFPIVLIEQSATLLVRGPCRRQVLAGPAPSPVFVSCTDMLGQSRAHTERTVDRLAFQEIAGAERLVRSRQCAARQRGAGQVPRCEPPVLALLPAQGRSPQSFEAQTGGNSMARLLAFGMPYAIGHQRRNGRFGGEPQPLHPRRHAGEGQLRDALTKGECPQAILTAGRSLSRIRWRTRWKMIEEATSSRSPTQAMLWGWRLTGRSLLLFTRGTTGPDAHPRLDPGGGEDAEELVNGRDTKVSGGGDDGTRTRDLRRDRPAF